jgi:hypothetical protein
MRSGLYGHPAKPFQRSIRLEDRGARISTCWCPVNRLRYTRRLTLAQSFGQQPRCSLIQSGYRVL